MKFIKDKLEKKILQKAINIRTKTMDNLQEKGIMGVNTIYQTYNYSLNGYLTGHPTKWQKRAFPYVIKGCSNGENPKYVKKLKQIHKKAKKNEPFSEQDFELLKEVKEWYDQNCLADTGKVLSVLGANFDDSKFSKTYSKLKKQERGVFN